MTEKGPDFLKKKYDLHKAPETETAAKRTEKRTNEKVPQAPEARIQNYLNRFKEIIDRKDPEKRERGLEAIKKVLYDKFVIQENEIPESYFELQKRIAREQGHGEIEISKEQKDQLTEVVITDQRTTLDNWVDYLSSPDATYPDWLKYWTIRSILGIGEYDKEKKEFTKRSKSTTKPFLDINREALAYVLDAVSKKYGQQHTNLLNLNEQERKDFESLLQGENFAKLYAWAIEKTTVAPQEALANTQGKWIKYNQGQDHMPLVQSLQGHGTGWCTAGESTAKTQLQGGDFYVFYSMDKKGKPTLPRVAIRMNGNQIGEVRGIAPDQNLDPYIGDIVQKKMTEFPDGKSYEKKAGDMKMLTAIEQKTLRLRSGQANQELTREELHFLYEMNQKIQGFGYQRDPRIEELRKQRNSEEDMLIIFECTKDQIAHTPKEINSNTKAYVGKIKLGIFQKLPENIEHVYTEFPDKKVFMKEIVSDEEIISAKTAIQKLEVQGHKIGDYARDMLSKVNWKESLKDSYNIISISVGELFGDANYHNYADIKAKARESGLDIIPASLAPSIRLNYDKNGEWTVLAMEAMRDRDGSLRRFGWDGVVLSRG
ncbi:MAG: hypothetical protein Q8P76_00995 [bacterium]|nr:hypothetical protein [bacterium]